MSKEHQRNPKAKWENHNSGEVYLLFNQKVSSFLSNNESKEAN